MLKQRVLTALVLLPLLLAVVFLAPTDGVVVLLALAGGLAAREWAALSSWGHRPAAGWSYAAAVVGLVVAVWWSTRWLPWLVVAVLVVALVHWLWAAWALMGYPQRLQDVRRSSMATMLQGAVLIVPTVVACGLLHALDQGALKLLFALFLVFAADVGAYFAGRRFGRHKLAPTISPGKTREGAVGGVLLCAVWALGAGIPLFDVDLAGAVGLVTLCVVIGLFSVWGDLLESAYKRLAGVKDSGRLLPGHGGILDRVDSVLAAVPLFALGLMPLGLA
jgi:phosphatidate cytidylyltransferase